MSPVTHIESDLLGFLLERQPSIHGVRRCTVALGSSQGTTSHSKVPGTVGLDAQSELLESGLLDSLLLLDLLLHIESTHGVALSASDVKPANFRNVLTLAQLVARRSQCKNPSGEAA